MQIVIEISEEYYKRCKDYVSANDADYPHIKIANGTPLPKGHGRLIDVRDLKTLYGLDDRLWWGNAVDEFTNLPTIIEGSDENEDSN